MSRGLTALLLLAGVAHADDAPYGVYSASNGKRTPTFNRDTPGKTHANCGVESDLAFTKLQSIVVEFAGRERCTVNGVSFRFNGRGNYGYSCTDGKHLVVGFFVDGSVARISVTYSNRERECGDGLAFEGTYMAPAPKRVR